MRLLKQIGTGDIYPWTEALASRPDMEEVVREPAQPTEQPAETPAETAPQEEIPTENSESASAEELPTLDDAVESFRRQASKASKKKDEQDNG
jgi:hypothetical protein